MLAKAWGQVKQLVECRFRELSSTQKLEIFFIRFDEGERKVLPLHLSDVLKLVGWSEGMNLNTIATQRVFASGKSRQQRGPMDFCEAHGPRSRPAGRESMLQTGLRPGSGSAGGSFVVARAFPGEFLRLIHRHQPEKFGILRALP